MAYNRPGLQLRGGKADVVLWAPFAKSVALSLPRRGQLLPLHQGGRGYWRLQSLELEAGELYFFKLDDDKVLPDPASLSQPEGVHGPSQAVDLQAFAWTDAGWNNIALEDYIIYELHTGTFSAPGTFEGIIGRLGYLKALGITAIEIMPVAAFPGSRNWGYDGVFPYAVHSAYGAAEGLSRLVDECHRQGLAVILDVVYNHVGPEGNYLAAFGPYFTDKYKTPWGSAINFDDAGCDGVRRFFIQNALMWFRDFHIDALRLDAVHAIRDFSAKHILQELREELDAMMAETGRTHYLIVETDLNDVRFINSLMQGGYGMDAQWLDEFHHALRVAAGQQRSGYYADFEGIHHLAKSYRDAYVYDGIYSPHREKTFGSRAAGNPGKQFIVFSQNHDQVGNRMLGERSSQLLSFRMQKLLAAAVVLSPFLPLLFMGEEYAETNPFLYFVSHTDPGLAEAVRKGRHAEFAAFHAQGEAPDPQAEETFARSKLQWRLTEQEPHATMLRYYKALLRLRKAQPALKNPDRGGSTATVDNGANMLMLSRRAAGRQLDCYLNFSADAQAVTLPTSGIKLFDSACREWGGSINAPDTVARGAIITIQPESVLIYHHDV
jgi:maltooligosyltrehalose trehalohydrolase